MLFDTKISSVQNTKNSGPAGCYSSNGLPMLAGDIELIPRSHPMRQHRDRLFTPSILVTSMIALLSISNAMAQEADSTTEADENVGPETMEEVVVYGF